jgi:hypothetical protein
MIITCTFTSFHTPQNLLETDWSGIELLSQLKIVLLKQVIITYPNKGQQRMKNIGEQWSEQLF